LGCDHDIRHARNLEPQHVRRADHDPRRRRYPVTGQPQLPSLLSESPRDQVGQLLECLLRILSARANRDLAAELGREHHDTHDALPVDLYLLFLHPDVRPEPVRQLDELGSRSRVQPVLVPDAHGTFVFHVGRTHYRSLTSSPKNEEPRSIRITGPRTRAPKRAPRIAATMAITVQNAGIDCPTEMLAVDRCRPATARGTAIPTRNAPTTGSTLWTVAIPDRRICSPTRFPSRHPSR